MTTETPSLRPSALDEIVDRTRSLYTLPVVAAEVIQLTNNPQVDARALKQCIENDPALTAKILRVVNSSLFGLSREVSDLNQALALLGTKPLKLLVLGFSLPENLFAEVAREQLQWYWRATLVRAVAAREISEQWWGQSGDDAFLAGLLQDIGVLVLLGQLQEPYAQFLGRVIEEHLDYGRIELESLGFNHTELSASLLQSWKMPEVLVAAIAESRDYLALAAKDTPAAALARVLHLATLLAELVGQNRLDVLPELLEAGACYCGLDKERLHDVVVILQEKVQQLAEVLSVELPGDVDYTSVLVEAHTQMAMLTEEVAERLSRPEGVESTACEEALADVAHLQVAVDQFLQRPVTPDKPKELPQNSEEPHIDNDVPADQAVSPTLAPLEESSLSKDFRDRLTWAVGRCRSQREPLSLLLVEVHDESVESWRELQVFSRAANEACHFFHATAFQVEAVAPGRYVVVLPEIERQQAVRIADKIIRNMEQAFDQMQQQEESSQLTISIGVASVALPPKNFPPMDLMITAQRCLAAARSSEMSVIKSLEIY